MRKAKVNPAWQVFWRFAYRLSLECPSRELRHLANSARLFVRHLDGLIAEHGRGERP